MIVVNARFLTQDLRGVQRFAECISLELNKIRNDVRFVAPYGVVRPDIARILKVEAIGKNGGQRWEQWDLPHWLRQQGSPLLLSLCSTAPFLYTKQIATHHDINYIRCPESYSWRFRTSYRLLMPLLLRRIKALITVSNFSRQEIADFYSFPNDSITVVQNAVADAFENPTTVEKKSTAYLLSVSSPSHHKNFVRLIEAFLALPRSLPVELRIVGDSHAVFGGLNLAELAANDQRIKLLGRIDDIALADQYRMATGFVFPSLYEGFGIPPLEAQACGCPVIAANTASMPEVLGDSVLYCDPNSTASITSAMATLLADPSLRSELREKGLKNARKFSWKKSAKQVSDLLDIALTSPEQRLAIKT